MRRVRRKKSAKDRFSATTPQKSDDPFQPSAEQPSLPHLIGCFPSAFGSFRRSQEPKVAGGTTSGRPCLQRRQILRNLFSPRRNYVTDPSQLGVRVPQTRKPSAEIPLILAPPDTIQKESSDDKGNAHFRSNDDFESVRSTGTAGPSSPRSAPLRQKTRVELPLSKEHPLMPPLSYERRPWYRKVKSEDFNSKLRVCDKTDIFQEPCSSVSAPKHCSELRAGTGSPPASIAVRRLRALGSDANQSVLTDTRNDPGIPHSKDDSGPKVEEGSFAQRPVALRLKSCPAASDTFVTTSSSFGEEYCSSAGILATGNPSLPAEKSAVTFANAPQSGTKTSKRLALLLQGSSCKGGDSATSSEHRVGTAHSADHGDSERQLSIFQTLSKLMKTNSVDRGTVMNRDLSSRLLDLVRPKEREESNYDLSESPWGVKGSLSDSEYTSDGTTSWMVRIGDLSSVMGGFKARKNEADLSTNSFLPSPSKSDSESEDAFETPTQSIELQEDAFIEFASKGLPMPVRSKTTSKKRFPKGDSGRARA